MSMTDCEPAPDVAAGAGAVGLEAGAGPADFATLVGTLTCRTDGAAEADSGIVEVTICIFCVGARAG